jgi:hypothetical protein
LHLAIVVLKQKAIVDLIRSEPPLLHHACLWLCCPFLKNLEFHPGEAAKRLAERKRSARAASLKSWDGSFPLNNPIRTFRIFLRAEVD